MNGEAIIQERVWGFYGKVLEKGLKEMEDRRMLDETGEVAVIDKKAG